jgi:hypothetical protein
MDRIILFVVDWHQMANSKDKYAPKPLVISTTTFSQTLGKTIAWPDSRSVG